MNPMKPEELREALKGICIISITPFKEDGAFDYDGYAKNLNYLLAHGLNKSNSTIVVGGSTGECHSHDRAGRCRRGTGCRRTDLRKREWRVCCPDRFWNLYHPLQKMPGISARA